MKINNSGITRLVIEFDKVVIKIPSFTRRWKYFLSGLLGNINEYENWILSKGDFDGGKDVSHLLAPIVWRSWGGWILIMKKADVEGLKRSLPNIVIHEKIYKDWMDNYLSGDDKINNYGLLEGRMVKIDYASLDFSIT